MPTKFSVDIQYTTTLTYQVEAKDIDDAEAIAMKRYARYPVCPAHTKIGPVTSIAVKPAAGYPVCPEHPETGPAVITAPIDDTDDLDMTPVGLQTQDGIRRVNRAIKAQQDATSRVADLLTEMREILDWSYTQIRLELISAGLDSDEASSRADAIVAATAARRATQEELLRAIAGAPPEEVRA